VAVDLGPRLGVDDSVGRRAILVVRGDEGRREVLVAHLRRRYDVDYEVLSEASSVDGSSCGTPTVPASSPRHATCTPLPGGS
jgi:hypothetical protein